MSRDDKRDGAIVVGILLALLLLLLWGALLELKAHPTGTTSTGAPRPGSWAARVVTIGGNPAPAQGTGAGRAPAATGAPAPAAPAPQAPLKKPAPVRWEQGLDHRCRIANGELICTGGNRHGQAAVPAGLGRVEQVATGQSATCVLRFGQPHCWGFRQGVGATNIENPRALDLHGATRLWMGQGGTTCALKLAEGGLDQKGGDDPGELWCWGEGVDPSAGQITGRSWADEPVKIATARDWDTVAVGWRTVCALQGKVNLRCWGAQPDGTHNPAGALLGNDPSWHKLRIDRLKETHERVCAIRRDKTEDCFG